MSALEKNCREFGIPLYDLTSANQGIVHVIGPELGLTQPGMTIACGDSHTSTHGAFGAIAFGIGTSQVRDVLASQCLAMEPLKVRRITVNSSMRPGVYAKDVILDIIRRLGVKGGTGYAYEYGGETFERMSMEERMTVCNMSIEGAARVGYVNPDETTFEYMQGRPFVPKGADFDKARAWWQSLASDPDANYDDEIEIDAATIEPTVTWGINPGQSIGISERIPTPSNVPPEEKASVAGGTRVHELPRRHADHGHEDRRRLHRVVHERPHLRPARSRAARQRPARGQARAGARRAGLAVGSQDGRGRKGWTRSSSKPDSNGAARVARCASR